MKIKAIKNGNTVFGEFTDLGICQKASADHGVEDYQVYCGYFNFQGFAFISEIEKALIDAVDDWGDSSMEEWRLSEDIAACKYFGFEDVEIVE